MSDWSRSILMRAVLEKDSGKMKVTRVRDEHKQEPYKEQNHK